MPFETRVFAQGRVRVTVRNSLAEADRATRGVASKVVHAGEKAGSVVDDTVVCQRCLGIAALDMSYESYECRNCGTLEWRWLSEDPREKPLLHLAVDGGYFPLADKKETGYFIDNPHLGAGLRSPAKLWMEGHHGNEHIRA